MKILAISDTHGDTRLIKKVAQIAKKEKIHLILHAGDLTYFDKEQKGLLGPLTENNREVLMVHGNHESEETLNRLSKIYPLAKSVHSKGIEKNNVGIFGSGTTDWGFIEDSKKIFKELKKGHEKVKKLEKKIMISHSPPAGSAIESLGFPGSYGVRKAIDQFKPDFLICGHIHEGGGLVEKLGSTTVINAAFTPIIFEI